ncbi:MAG: GGDEF domain-containing protein [Vicinamibacterales bacterium]
MSIDFLGQPAGRRNPGDIAWWPMRQFLTRSKDGRTGPIWIAWLATTLVSIAFAFLEARFNWSGMPVPLGGRAVGFTLYPPVAISAFVAFWLGPTYGATTAYVSTLVSGLVGGLDSGRAALFALGTPAEVLLLWFLSTILRVHLTMREYRDWWRFFAAALIAVTASSLDIMLYNEAHRLSIPDGQRLWEGWIFGDMAQLCLIVAPALWASWSRMHRWTMWRLGAPQRELSARNTVLLLGFVWITLAGLALFGLRLLARAHIPGPVMDPGFEPLLARLGEIETFLVVLVGALLFSTMALTAALADTGQQHAAISLRDDLTGAFNRRAFGRLFEREEERSRALDRPIAMVCFDLDHFKTIDDQLGHTAGDRVLMAVTAEAQAILRAQDLLFRWGGDEFVILLPHTSADEAHVIAEQLRTRVAERVSVVGPSGAWPVTLSAGVAARGPTQTGLDELVIAADTAVYRAKAHGRNRVVTFTPVTS